MTEAEKVSVLVRALQQIEQASAGYYDSVARIAHDALIEVGASTWPKPAVKADND